MGLLQTAKLPRNSGFPYLHPEPQFTQEVQAAQERKKEGIC